MGLAEHERDRASAAWVIIGAESPYSAEADHRFRPDDRRFRAMPIVALERSVAALFPVGLSRSRSSERR